MWFPDAQVSKGTPLYYAQAIPNSQHPYLPVKRYRRSSTGSVHAAEIQGYLAHKEHPPPLDHHWSLGTGLL